MALTVRVPECSGLHLTPGTGSPAGVVRSAFLNEPGAHPNGEQRLDGPAVSIGVQTHLAVVVDDSGNAMALYIDGELGASRAFTDHLSDIHDINNWLGRSQFLAEADEHLDGSSLEFRIYDAALTESEIETSFTEGPDAAFLD